jgi:ferredoxin
MATSEPDFFSVGLEDTAKIKSYEPDREEVRQELLGVLAQAKAAIDECPWDERTFKYHKVVFPQMANWLPADERDQLRFEFAQEVERIELLMAA